LPVPPLKWFRVLPGCVISCRFSAFTVNAQCLLLVVPRAATEAAADAANASEDSGEDQQDDQDDDYYPYPLISDPEKSPLILCHEFHSFQKLKTVLFNNSCSIVPQKPSIPEEQQEENNEKQ
jgi:hypothetical protein